MKKLFVLIMLLSLELCPAQAQRIYFKDGAWQSFMNQRSAFELVCYGLYSNGVEKNRFYPNGTNANERIALVPNRFFHVNTLDGDFVYTAKIDGEYLYLSNRTRTDVKSEPQTGSSWIKLIWCENGNNGMTLFTVDSFGIYRYFRYIGTLDK